MHGESRGSGAILDGGSESAVNQGLGNQRAGGIVHGDPFDVTGDLGEASTHAARAIFSSGAEMNFGALGLGKSLHQLPDGLQIIGSDHDLGDVISSRERSNRVNQERLAAEGLE